MLQSVFAGHAKIPPGPMPQQWQWLWVPELTVPPYDTAQAAQLLAARGWRDTDGDGVRDRAGKKLSFHLLVPSSSAVRQQYALLLQEQLKAVGVEVLIDQMEPATPGRAPPRGSVRRRAGILEHRPDPHLQRPRDLGAAAAPSNFGHYANPTFDRQVATAASAATPEAAEAAWIAAFGTLAHDAPAIMLFSVDNIAAVDSRVADVRIRPDSWWALLWTWRIPPDKLNERDRVGG